MLEVKGLTVHYGELTIVNDVSFSVKEGQWLMIAGPNGAGKSTVLNAVSGGAPYTGSVLLNNTDIRKRKPSELARELGVLAQSNSVSYSFTVEEVIRLGRYAYSRGMLSPRSADDETRINEAVRLTGLEPLLNQSVLTLSGGELRRTFLAQLFAQNPTLLMLDEPTNHLDLVYQKQVFALLSEWLKQSGRAIVSVVHDLSLAKAFGTHALLLDRGRVLAYGSADEVLTAENLASAYSMDVFGWMRSMLSQWQ